MTDKKELIKEIILKNPNLLGNKIYELTKSKGLGIRKTNFYALFREIKNLPEPSIQKREQSVPIKYKIKPIVKPKLKVKPKKISFEKTKFGKMTKSVQTRFNISERNAIIRVRGLLKIPRTDYHKLSRNDRDILTQYGY